MTMDPKNTPHKKIEKYSNEYFNELQRYLLREVSWKEVKCPGYSFLLESHQMIIEYIALAKGATNIDKLRSNVFFNTNKDILEQVEQKMQDDLGLNNKKKVSTEQDEENDGEQTSKKNTFTGVSLSHILSGIGPQQEALIREQLLYTPLEKFENKSLKDLINNVATIEDVSIIESLIAEIKSKPEFISAPDSLRISLYKELSTSKEKITGTHISKELDNFEIIDFNGVDIAVLLGYLYQINTLQELRSSLTTPPNNDDVRLKQLQTTISGILKQSKSQVLSQIDSIMTAIDDYCATLDRTNQITSVYRTTDYKHYHTIKQILTTEQQEQYTTKIKEIIEKHQGILQEKGEQEKIQSETNKKNLQQDIDSNIKILQETINNTDDQGILNTMSVNDPLVDHIYELVDSKYFSALEQEQYKQKVKVLFKAKLLQLGLSKDNTNLLNLEDLGINPSLCFQEHETQIIGYKVKAIPIGGGNNRLELHLENGTNHVFDINMLNDDIEKYGDVMIGSNLKTFMSQEEFITYGKKLSEWKKTGKKKLSELKGKLNELKKSNGDESEVKKLQEEIKDLQNKYKEARYTDLLVQRIAHKLNINPRPYLEKKNEKFIVLDEEKEILKNLSNGLISQQEMQKGIDILEGPPGLGKTEICKYLASSTNRQIVRVQCSKMDPSDMFFSPQLKAGETSRQPADWIKLMQQPGVIILFDEIDKLNDQCFEKLHSLFDSGRSVYDPQLGMIKANKDCLFLGTRNSYDRLSNPVVSRSTITYIKAPSPANEAYKISKYLDKEYWNTIDYNSFKLLYEEHEAGAGTHLKSLSKDDIFALQLVTFTVKLFQDLRERQIENNHGERFEYEISYRDAQQIFSRFNSLKPSEGKASEYKDVFKQCVSDILIPKSRAVVLDNDEKNIQEKIIQQLLDSINL